MYDYGDETNIDDEDDADFDLSKKGTKKKSPKKKKAGKLQIKLNVTNKKNDRYGIRFFYIALQHLNICLKYYMCDIIIFN